jgi:hypothetical protein
MFEEARRVMAAQERGWDTKTADELEMIGKLTETCKKLKAEKGALEVRYIPLCVYLIRFECHIEKGLPFTFQMGVN